MQSNNQNKLNSEFSDILPEIKAKILGYLPSHDKLACFSTSKNERELLGTEHSTRLNTKLIKAQDLEEFFKDFKQYKDEERCVFNNLCIEIGKDDDVENLIKMLKNNSNFYKNLSIIIVGDTRRVLFLESDRHVEPISEALRSLPIISLNLGNCEIDAKLFASLAQAMQNSNLKHLDISRCNIFSSGGEINFQGVCALADVLKSKENKLISLNCNANFSLRTIELVNIESTEVIEHLMEPILNLNCHLQHLDFHSNADTTLLLVYFDHILSEKNSLKSFGLYTPFFELEKGFEYMAYTNFFAYSLISSNCKLESLHLSFCSVNNEIIDAICKSLRDTKCTINQFTADCSNSSMYGKPDDLQRLGQDAIKERQEKLRKISTMQEEATKRPDNSDDEFGEPSIRLEEAQASGIEEAKIQR